MTSFSKGLRWANKAMSPSMLAFSPWADVVLLLGKRCQKKLPDKAIESALLRKMNHFHTFEPCSFTSPHSRFVSQTDGVQTGQSYLLIPSNIPHASHSIYKTTMSNNMFSKQFCLQVHQLSRWAAAHNSLRSLTSGSVLKTQMTGDPVFYLLRFVSCYLQLSFWVSEKQHWRWGPVRRLYCMYGPIHMVEEQNQLLHAGLWPLHSSLHMCICS